jgi:hypothetical protein
MKLLLALAVAWLPVIAPAQTPEPESVKDPEQCPALTAEQLEEAKRGQLAERKVHRRVSALVGVDALGRVLMAIDYDRDEIVEEVVLFTGRERLEGPWGELIRSAEIEVTTGTLRFEARDRSIAIALAVHPAELPTLKGKRAAFKRLIEQSGGHELVRNSIAPEYGRHMSSFDHALIDSWPESFRDDLIVPGTGIVLDDCFNCGTADCQVGGCLGASCSKHCSGIVVNDACSIGCNPDRAFPCCNCTNGIFFPIASCRCIACRKLIGPLP